MDRVRLPSHLSLLIITHARLSKLVIMRKKCSSYRPGVGSNAKTTPWIRRNTQLHRNYSRCYSFQFCGERPNFSYNRTAEILVLAIYMIHKAQNHLIIVSIFTLIDNIDAGVSLANFVVAHGVIVQKRRQ